MLTSAQLRAEWQPPTEVPGPGSPREIPESEPEQAPPEPPELPGQPGEIPPTPPPEVRRAR